MKLIKKHKFTIVSKCLLFLLTFMTMSLITVDRAHAMMDGMTYGVHAIAFGPDRAVYFGGGFDSAGGKPVKNIAKWNGSEWSTLGTGFDDNVTKLAVSPDGKIVYAGGYFQTAGGKAAEGIAMWDGVSWSPMGKTLVGRPDEMIVDNDGAFYVLGSFNTDGGNLVKSFAKWDGQKWNQIDSTNDILDSSNRLLIKNNKFYLNADLMNASVSIKTMTITWNGNSWNQLTNAELTDLIKISPESGYFRRPGAPIQKWDGSKWKALESNEYTLVSDMIVTSDDKLYAVSVPDEGNTPGGKDVLQWDGKKFRTIGSASDGHVVNSIAVSKDGLLYAAGSFAKFKGKPMNCVAKWNGKEWSPLGKGIKYKMWQDMKLTTPKD